MRSKFLIIFLTSLASLYLQGQNSPNGEVHTKVEEMPEYPGGNAELIKFLRENVHFPARCRNDSTFTSCRVFVKFVVNEEGLTEQAQVLKGCATCPEADQESIRVVALMPRWKPGRIDNRNVKVYYTLPFSFKLR